MTANELNRPDAVPALAVPRARLRIAALLIAAAWLAAISLTMAVGVRVSLGAEPASAGAQRSNGEPLDFEPWCEAPSRSLVSWTGGPPRALLESLLADHLARGGVPRARRVTSVLVSTAMKHGVDPLLVVSLMEVESGYRPGARSAAGALGLLQVRPATAREVAEQRGLAWSGPAQLFVPEVNVRLGTLYLADLLDQFDDLEHALAAYNRGPTAVSRALSEGGAVPREFAARVTQAYQDLRAEIQADLLIEPKPTWIASERFREPRFES